jgi:hypothetical protein
LRRGEGRGQKRVEAGQQKGDYQQADNALDQGEALAPWSSHGGQQLD